METKPKPLPRWAAAWTDDEGNHSITVIARNRRRAREEAARVMEIDKRDIRIIALGQPWPLWKLAGRPYCSVCGCRFMPRRFGAIGVVCGGCERMADKYPDSAYWRRESGVEAV